MKAYLQRFSLPILILGVAMPMILLPSVIHDFYAAWDRTEFLASFFILNCFLAGAAMYTYTNSQSRFWTQKYAMNSAILLVLGYLMYLGSQSSLDMPLLGVMGLIVLVTTPVLVLFQALIYVLRGRI